MVRNIIFLIFFQTVKLWSVDSGEELKSVHVSNSTSVMAVSYNQGFFACSFAETILLYAWDGESAKKVRSFEEHKKRYTLGILQI